MTDNTERTCDATRCTERIGLGCSFRIDRGPDRESILVCPPCVSAMSMLTDDLEYEIEHPPYDDITANM